MAASNRVAVIVPTYNEAENLPSLITQLLEFNLDLVPIVVDDNSPDGTGELADSLAGVHPQVSVIHRKSKLGLGTAYIAGFRRAFELGADFIMTMDADFSHNPKYVPVLIESMTAHDLVIGSRYVPGGGTLYCTWSRRVLSQGANTFAKLMLGLQAHDCTAGFRCYRREALVAIDLDQIFSSGYSFLIEMIYKCQQLGFRIGEVPIVFENRQCGASKISQLEIVKAVYTIFRLRWDKLPWDVWVASWKRRSAGESSAGSGGYPTDRTGRSG